MAERVAHHATAFAIKFGLRRPLEAGAGSASARDDYVGIVHMKVDGDRCAAKGTRCADSVFGIVDSAQN